MKKICICSSLTVPEAADELSHRFRTILLPPDPLIAEPVSCHPDMICAIMDSVLFIHSSYAEANHGLMTELTEESALQTVLTHEPRAAAYPNDIALNAAVLPDRLVCCPAHTSPMLLRAAEKSGRLITAVKQGYSSCSTLVCGESVLTSDTGIFNALSAGGIDCEFIPTEGILLPGYSCGFIGGCCGFSDGIIYIIGSPDSFDGGRILLDFAAKRGFGVIPLYSGPVIDCGGLKFVDPLPPIGQTR